jgi:hypothetical protein
VTKTLKPEWYRLTIDPSVDMEAAGVYQWSIEGVGLYVGKAKILRKRLPAYPNNVRRMLENLPWHGNPSKKYREIHHALRQAYETQTPVTVTVLETCDPSVRVARERHWIRLRLAEAEQGGPRVLNPT